MTYRSGASFRRALEDRLRAQSLETGVPLVRLRKMVVFDRFLARLVQGQPDAWVLKGGTSSSAATWKPLRVVTPQCGDHGGIEGP